MLKFLSEIWSGKTGLILFVAIAIGTFGGVYYITEKLTDMSSSISTLQSKNTELEGKIGGLRQELADREKNTNKYISNLNFNQQNLNKRLDDLDKARSKEPVVAAKPKLATKVAKEKVEDLQERISCVTGNMESCSRLQSSSAVQAPKTVVQK